MHHRPVGPPLTARLHGALTRWLLLTRRALRGRGSRLALAGLLAAVVTGLVLGVPVVSGSGGGRPSVALDASSSAAQSSTGDSPVVMGRDGKPVTSSTFAGLESATTSSAPTAIAADEPEEPTGRGGPSVPTSGSQPGTTGPAPVPPSAANGASPDDTPSPAESATASRDTAPPAAGTTTTVPTLPGTASAEEPAAPAATGAEEQVLALVNAERAAAGCGALVADAGLAAVARAHSEDMRDSGFFGHVNLEGLGAFDRAEQAGLSARAENIARGQQDPAAVMADWMDSEGHRENILDCDLSRLGVGIADGDRGPWWTQLFA